MNVENKIAEFRFDKSWINIIQDKGYAPRQETGGWKFIAFRPDKHIQSDEVLVADVWRCIQDGVAAPEIMARMDIVRRNWKARERGESQSLYDFYLMR